MIKLIASDVDGTLIRYEDAKTPEDLLAPTPKAFELIRECLDRGITFAVASGRQYDNLKRMFASIWRELYFISDNGHILIHKDHIQHKVVMPSDLAMDVIHYIIDTPNCEIMVSTPTHVYVMNKPEDRAFSDLVFYETKYTAALIDDVEILKFDDIIKISAYVDLEFLEEYVERFKKDWGDILQITKSGGGWVDFGISGKGAALRNLMDSLEVTKDEVMVFGDNFNDIEMFSAAEHTYAMSTADDAVKIHAKYTTKTVEEVLEHFLKTGEIKKQ